MGSDLNIKIHVLSTMYDDYKITALTKVRGESFRRDASINITAEGLEFLSGSYPFPNLWGKEA